MTQLSNKTPNLLNRAPVILLGTHRSGTSWLGNMLAQHPDLAYWAEPRYVWSLGNAYKPDDLLSKSDVTPRIKRRIQNRFDKYVLSSGKKRLLEKTPNNCLRLSFINAIYPEAKVIHIIRDGRAVFNSSNRVTSSSQLHKRSLLFSRFLELGRETPIVEWPANFSRILEVANAKILGKPLSFWGPRPPGWRQWLEGDSRNVILAKQWAATIEQALDDSEALTSKNYYRFSYEELMENPREEIRKIFDFTEINDENGLVDKISDSVKPGRARAWSTNVSETTLNEIRPYIEPVLIRLGYVW